MNVNRSTARKVFYLAVLASFLLLGCGASEDDIDNTRPSIRVGGGTITNQALTLAVDSWRSGNIYITDDDVDDTHTISVSSANPAVATASVADTTEPRPGVAFSTNGVMPIIPTRFHTTLTITGRSVGSTTVTFIARDNSGGDNATARLVYRITVVDPDLIVSTSPLQLTELPFKGSVVTLEVAGLIYSRGKINVSGIRDFGPIRLGGEGDTAEFFDLDYVSHSVAKLTFLDNFDTGASLTFTVEARAIAAYDGPPLTVEIPVMDAIDILGPWLWMAVPTDPSAGGGVSTEVDSLAETSGGRITETDVANHGAREGDVIGEFQWMSGQIGYEHTECEWFCARTVFAGCVNLCWFNNINDTLNALGFGTGRNIEAHTAYALINLVSPSNQDDAIMGVKSGDATKIWLNGEMIHREAATALGCRKFHVHGLLDPTVCTPDPHYPVKSVFPVSLKAGNNLLLVKVRQHGDYWGMRIQLLADFVTAVPQR